MNLRECTLGDVIKLQRGHDLPERERVEGTIPIVSSSGITGRHNVAKAEPPGVVTGRYGTIGEVFYLEEPYWPLNTALYVVDFKGNDPRYIAYLLRNILKNYRSEKAAVPGVDRNVLHLLQIRAIGKPKQREIASILSAYDDLIENNRRRIELLEEAARLLYREWFVYFRFPGHEHAKMLDGVPEGWERHTLSDLAVDVDYGFTASADPQIEGPKFLRITDIVNGPINWATVPRCSISEADQQRFLVAPADIVVARTGATTGWARRVGRHAEAAVFASYLVRFRFSNAYRPELAATYMQSAEYKAFVRANVGGAAQPNASAKVLGRAPVPVPTSLLQEQFAESVGPMLAQIDILTEQNQKLAQARDALLPRLMSGDIEV
jgi:type I restriction enzyme S subunit